MNNKEYDAQVREIYNLILQKWETTGFVGRSKVWTREQAKRQSFKAAQNIVNKRVQNISNHIFFQPKDTAIQLKLKFAG